MTTGNPSKNNVIHEPDTTDESLPLDDFGVLRIRGADAIRFLQGQLSNDLRRLTVDQPLFAGLHNVQGRVVALLRLAALAEGDVLALLPRELAAPVAERLRKYVLRAKVMIEDASDVWSVRGTWGATERHEAERGAWIALDDASSRRLLIEPRGERTHEASDAGSPDRAREDWRLADVAGGLPQVYGATTERFVAQMLNLDSVGALAFDKGCYTGQEIIARAHYRGRVKRRMQRFRTREPLELTPGANGQLRDGRSFTVVDSARTVDGAVEFLAVATLAASGAEETEHGGGGAERGVGPLLDAEPLPLPYALPD